MLGMERSYGYKEPETKRSAITYKQTGKETSKTQGKVTQMSENESKLNNQLDLDDLDSVAGGYVFAADTAYEVIDNQGNVVESFGCDPDHTPSVFEARRRAKEAARNRGLSDSEIPWEMLRNMRN